MNCRNLNLALATLILTLSGAQAEEESSIPFADGAFTISETDSMERVLSYNGTEIVRGYFLDYDRIVEIGTVEAALFQVGAGGNACGPRTVIAWKPEDEELKTALAGDDCGSPSPAITDSAIYFVPYLLPGTSAEVQVWTPDEGLTLAGTLSYTPQPGTSWDSLNIDDLAYPVDAFSNEAVYKMAQTLLGNKLVDVATGLSVTDGFHKLASGIAYASGCVPHACGSADAFMAIDKANRKLYFAQQDGNGGVEAWPALSEWPEDVRKAMQETIEKN